jgi:dTDP-4-amino-4,6-dideoxygalactose transaminase
MADEMIPLFKVHMPPRVRLIPALEETLYSGYVAQGPRVDEFEAKFGEYIGWDKVVAVNSGTSALTMALRLAGVERGDLVITTPMTCTATNLPILALGAIPVFADVNPISGLIDLDSVANLLEQYNAAAIMTVDWGGLSCDYQQIMEIARRYGVRVIRDAAHSLGAIYHGRLAGRPEDADFTCFRSTTRVTTQRGTLKICDVVVGDRVLTGEGSWQLVVNVLSRDYKGAWSVIKAGQTRLVATSNHPILIYRDNRDQWLPIEAIRKGDAVYCETKPCAGCGNSLVPFYGSLCSHCYQATNKSHTKRVKVQASRKKVARLSSRRTHHSRVVSPVMEEYRAQGYRVIPLIAAIPDFIAVKDGKMLAVEVESSTTIRLGKENKYEALNGDGYDDVVWHTRDLTRDSLGRYSYTIVGTRARVPVSSVNHYLSAKNHRVYNLTVENDSTYFARGVLVHNCFSLQAIKHITTGDGGVLAVSDSIDLRRARLMRWYGIDRTGNVGDSRIDVDINEWGYKFHMNDITATIGLAQMPYAPGIVGQHRANAQLYHNVLSDYYVKPWALPDTVGSYWLYTILLPSESERDGFKEFMLSKGIQVSQVHKRNDEYAVFKSYAGEDLPGLEYFSRRMICIPVHLALTNADRVKIIDATNEWVGVPDA